MTYNEQSGRRVLVVDDEPMITSLLARELASAGYIVGTANDVGYAIGEISRVKYHAAFVDVSLGSREGFEVLAFAMGLEEPPAFIMMSGRAEVSRVVAAMRGGATDFLEKPFDMADALVRLERVLEHPSSSRRMPKSSETRTKVSVTPPPMSTGAMAHALALADKVAATPSSSALLVGESGVGKEVIAARIHHASTRRGGPFVRVNLAAISESVLEAELFGSVKGAFTDSKANRAGYLASADNGTILLDEIGEFRIDNQPKLLRVLEERRFFPVGSDRERSLNVRVLAATNREPQAMLESKILRPDLFYRLGTVIHIPPLRERTDEIMPLAEHFLSLFCNEFQRPVAHLSAPAAEMLIHYVWPGNVRQLRNAVERALMITEGDEIPATAFDLPPPSLNGVASSGMPASYLRPPSRRISAPHRLHDVRSRALQEVERAQIVRALEAAKGSRSRAAALLGLSRSTLYDKLKRYNLG